MINTHRAPITSALAASLVLTAARAASAQEAPPPPPTAPEPAPAGCPYAAQHPHCQGHGHVAMRIAGTATAAITLTAGVVFQVLASIEGAHLAQLYDARDPNHAYPISSYADLAAMDQDRSHLETAAIGFLIGGGVLSAAALFFLLPHHHGCCHHHMAEPPPVAFGVAPNGASLTLRF